MLPGRVQRKVAQWIRVTDTPRECMLDSAPAGAVAAALLVTVMYFQQRSAVAPADDLAMLADAEVYALNADTEHELDYDFYEWAVAAAPEVQSGT